MIFEKNLTLVGLMGAGKTTIGRALAKRLDAQFYDSDKVIEANTGVSIPTIFELEGEERFRQREAKVIEDLLGLKSCVVATGGGVILHAQNRLNIKRSDLCIYLRADPDVLWERLKSDRMRPLLKVADPLLRLRELYATRHPLYEEVADLSVEANGADIRTIIKSILKELRLRWEPLENER